MLAISPKYASVPSIQKMQERYTSLTRKNADLRDEVKGKVGTVESVGFTQLGAGLAGIASAYGWSEGTMGVVGAVVAMGGLWLGQPTAVHLSNGFLAPLTFAATQKWAMERRTAV
jgi:hypothetical protein